MINFELKIRFFLSIFFDLAPLLFCIASGAKLNFAFVFFALKFFCAANLNFNFLLFMQVSLYKIVLILQVKVDFAGISLAI